VITRRRFLTGSVITLTPIGATASAQEYKAGKVSRIGVLTNYPSSPSRFSTFIMTMRDLGYVEGRDFVLEIRSAEHKPDRLPALAAELANLKVDIIITGGDSEVRAAKQATRTIPIVMAPSGDPVAAGYVASFAKPGGNITGLSWMSPELSAKLLEVLKATVPRLARVAVLWNAANPVKMLDFDKTRRAAEALGITVSSIEVRSLADFEMAFAKIVRERSDGLLSLVDEVLNPRVFPRIAQFAVQERLPSILGQPEYATAGGLLGYGPTVTEVYRRAAVYVDRILKGAKPGDLPIEQPTRLEFVINAKTAKALGLTIPQSLLARADEVIQ
jgi:putative ABC transport system substrate-binding protein